MDQILSFITNFHRVYKKTFGKLRLLFSLRSYISKIYRGILLPVLLYARTTNLSLTNTQLSKLSSLDRRIARLTTKRQIPIQNEMKKHAVLLGRKYLDRQLRENFQNFFTVGAHEQNTRIMGLCLEFQKSNYKFPSLAFGRWVLKYTMTYLSKVVKLIASLIFKEHIKNHFKI